MKDTLDLPLRQTLDELPHAQRERLAFIDFSLQYFGHVTRQDLINRFATGLAAGTRDFSLYRQLAPDNMVLDQATKQYLRRDEFTPLFVHNPETILHSLSRGFGDGLSGQIVSSEHCLNAVGLIHPDASIIASLMRAIHNGMAVRATYVSLTSGETERELVPHAIVNNGHRWHVRAFDRASQTFRDFVCTRFVRVDALASGRREIECSDYDGAWQRHVTLELIAHPGLTNPAAVHMDYAMKDGRKTVTVRAALAAYLLRYWQVDCSESARILGQGCQLALENRDVLNDIENAHLAPGASAK
ncbi:WYL domain-containing protein [Alteromonas sp. CYL-A6]|uniref:WYL domain-containing protein n=1 Tax=Alteromonas nitratireducens TaxID=3390813 RepID=UPI0034C496F3